MANRRNGTKTVKVAKWGIHNLIGPEDAHMLWKDEIGDTFLLLKTAEVYLWSDEVVRLYCWSFQTRSQLLSEGLISHEMDTDDSFYTLDTDRKNLARIIALGGRFRRRPYARGKWIRSLEERLGHKIRRCDLKARPGATIDQSRADLEKAAA